MNNDRLKQQIQFILEIDKLKQVFRQSYLIDGTRFENDAEHSWHLAVMAMLLKEYAMDASLDLSRVLEMVLAHDLVEVYAGDTYVYDEARCKDQHEREEQAAEKLFGLLPTDQGTKFRALWDEFEAKETPEAQYAASLDRLQPILLNYYSQGRSWRQHQVKLEWVLERNNAVKTYTPDLWPIIEEIVQDSLEKGYLLP